MKIDIYSQQLYVHAVISSAGREEGMERQRIGSPEERADGWTEGVEVGREGWKERGIERERGMNEWMK